MPDIIRLLPESLANQIAAGEVVQRPASVVKELLENSIDAGSTRIKVIVKEAGRQLIQVIDNGKGMTDTDARMSFERHATSKLRTTEDLFNIRTMGFRGEAMASIAAVAQVELKSRTPDQELGTQLIIEGSEVKSQTETASPVGTSICVKNLFFNVPARRNFLKSNAVELRHIFEEFQRAALGHPHIAFSLFNNDLEVFNLPAGKLSQRIIGLFGASHKEQMARCEEKTSVVNIGGYIGKPEFAKRTRGEQYFFVNQRYIRSNYLHHAVVTAFEGLLPKESHPFYVLFLEIDPKQIDINVHPTKTEIKFEDEKTIYAVVRSAVKQALGAHNIIPSIDFEQNVNFSAFQNAAPNEYGSDKRNSDGSISIGNTSFRMPAFPSNNNLKSKGWELLYEGLKNGERTENEPRRPLFIPVSLPEESPDELPLKAAVTGEGRVMQLHSRYIVSQVKSGLMLLDQQAALERIYYEKYRLALEKRAGATQQLLFPQVLEFNAQDFALLMELLPDLQAIGFDLADFGNRSVSVQGVPSGLTDVPERELLEGLLEQYKQNQGSLKLDRPESLTRAMARRHAAKPASRLTVPDMTALIDQLFACQVPLYTPSGTKTLVLLGFEQLGALFQKDQLPF